MQHEKEDELKNEDEKEEEVKNGDVASAGGQDPANEASKVSHGSHRRSSIVSWQNLRRYCQIYFYQDVLKRLCARVYAVGAGGWD